jgi:hypothetical protein
LESLDISLCELKGVLNLDQLSENCARLKRLDMLQCYPKIAKYTSIHSIIASPRAFLALEHLSLSFSQNFGTNPMIMFIAK